LAHFYVGADSSNALFNFAHAKDPPHPSFRRDGEGASPEGKPLLAV